MSSSPIPTDGPPVDELTGLAAANATIFSEFQASDTSPVAGLCYAGGAEEGGRNRYFLRR